MRKPYERQHLGAFAAGFISADGHTAVGFGCSLTRMDLGMYGVLLGSDPKVHDSDLPKPQDFVFVTLKGIVPLFKGVLESTTNPAFKTIVVVNANGSEESFATDTDIEVVVYRSVTK
jgi:hypothetical protein